MRSSPRAAAGRCSSRGAPPRARGRCGATSAIVLTPLVTSAASIARAASVSWAIASSRVSASSSSESCASSRSSRVASAQSEIAFAACSPCGVSGTPALSMPTTIVSVACDGPLEARRGRSPCDPAVSPTAAPRCPRAGCASASRISSTIDSISPAPDADRAADAVAPTRRPDTVSPLSSRSPIRATDADDDDDADDDRDDPERAIRASSSFLPRLRAARRRTPTSRLPEPLDRRDARPARRASAAPRSAGRTRACRGPGTLSPITAVSSPACTAVTIGGSPNSRSYDASRAPRAPCESRSGRQPP